MCLKYTFAKKKQIMKKNNILIILFFLQVLFIASSKADFEGIDEKCSACNAIIYELDRALRFEIKGSAIQTGRLDSRGKRVGKKTNYEVSELRAILIMDNLCPQLQHYGKTVMDDGRSKWQRINYAEGDVHIDGTMTIGGAQSHTEGQQLKVWCDAMVEKYEEEFEKAVQAGPDGLNEKLCVNGLRVCAPDGKSPALPAPPTSKKKKQSKKKRKLTTEEKEKKKLNKQHIDLRNELERVNRLKDGKIAERNKLKEEIKLYKNQAQKLKDKLKIVENEMSNRGMEL